MPLTIGVPRETFAGEKRVATVPEVVEKLLKLGFKVCVERGAGDAAHFSDEAYRAAGATVAGSAAELYAAADVAFVGGSLQEIGGHNLLEPAALGVARRV